MDTNTHHFNTIKFQNGNKIKTHKNEEKMKPTWNVIVEIAFCFENEVLVLGTQE